MSVKFSADEYVESVAVIERPVPEMMPDVTEFWNIPSALPIAITC